MKTPSKVLAVVVAAVIVAAAATSVSLRLLDAPDLHIGGKDFTEQLILEEMMAILIEETTALKVDRRPYLGGTMVCFNALRGGDLDVYAEYTGTGLVNILEEPVIRDPDEAYETVKRRFADEYGVVWLKPFGFNNTYTLTMRAEQAKEIGIRTFTDLAEYVRAGKEPKLSAGFTAEFLDRPDGYKGLTKAYDFRFADEPKQLDPGLMYRACADGSVDVICGFATDGRIAAFGLATLADDKGFFPPYFAAPVIRADTLRRHPHLEQVLGRLGGRIDDAAMQRLNYQVDRKDNPRRARDVAREFLLAEKLIPPGADAAADE